MITGRRWRGEQREIYFERDTGRRFFLYRTLEGEYAIDKWIGAPQYLERVETVSTHEEALQELAQYGCVDTRSEGEGLMRISVGRGTSVDDLRRIVRSGSNSTHSAIVELARRGSEANQALDDLLHVILDDLGHGTRDDERIAAIRVVAQIAPNDEKVVAVLKRVATAGEPSFSVDRGNGIVIQVRRAAWFELNRLDKDEGIEFP